MTNYNALVVAITCLSLAGCVSNTVKKEDRDQTGRFDGKWQITYNFKKMTRVIGNMEYSCEEDKGELSMTIKDGQLSDGLKPHEPTFVNSNGHLEYASAPADGRYVLSSERPEDNGKRLTSQILASIDLQDSVGTGTITLVIGAGSSGCPGTLRLVKKS